MNFELPTTKAIISNLNVRPEKHGPDEKVLGTDINFTVQVPCHDLGQLSFDADMDYGSFLYDEKGQVKSHGIEKLNFGKRQFEEQKLTLSTSGLEPNVGEQFLVTLKKFNAEPVFGRQVKLSFQAQFHPTGGDINQLTEGLLRDCYITIEGTDQIQDQEEIDIEEETETLSVVS